MKVICSSLRWRQTTQGLGIALGNFDGVHLGHQAILKKMCRAVRQKGWKSAVYTFDPHPAKILAPKSAPPLLQTLEQKLAFFRRLGLDFVILEKFDAKFSRLPARQFLQKILVDRLRVKGIWVGYDFTFGHQRLGNVEKLRNFCQNQGIDIAVMPAQFTQKALVSSTQIRALVSEGEVALAQKLLGRPFALIGKVVKGKGIGGKLGIHTANVKVENELLPKNGIYITSTTIPRLTTHDSRLTTYPSATSVGFNPTFPGKGFSVETHLIGFKGNLWGKKIEVAFLKWLRDELTFPNAETLATQIQKDIAETKKFHLTTSLRPKGSAKSPARLGGPRRW